MVEPLFILSREDWSLHRKGEINQARHQRKVREAIQHRLADWVSDQSIIMSQGEHKLKVPIYSLDEPRFRYRNEPRDQIQQGNTGHRASDQAGEDIYEIEITIDEIADLMFEDFHLPKLKPHHPPLESIQQIQFQDIRKKGVMSNIDKRRTLIEAMKRQALAANKEFNFQYDDLRFKTWDEIKTPQTSAVVFAMMDTSGSMGTFEKYMARSFYFWMVRFLRTKYERVVVRFLAHHTEAKEVDEVAFFTKGESGGTRCSSVYRLAYELMMRDYGDGTWNIYAFHFTDGDNLYSDNELTVEWVQKMLERTNMLGYGEIRGNEADPKLWEFLVELKHDSFMLATLTNKSDVYRTLRAFFGHELLHE